MVFSNLKLLLVEDNPGDVRLVQEALKDSELVKELVHCDKLSIALEKLQKSQFDLVLLDLSLPDSKGLDTFFTVRKKYSQIPIIIFTGYEDETQAFEAFSEGVQTYLIKDRIDSNFLNQAIYYALKKTELLKDLDNN